MPNERAGWLVFDTETTGIPNNKLPADDPAQPRLAAVTIFRCDESLHVLDTQSAYIKPDGWVMPEEITQYNGITQDILERLGEPIRPILDRYVSLIDEGYAVAAYGAQFDCKVMRGELRRAGIDDRFTSTQNLCIMRKCMGVVIKANGKKGMPKLKEAVEHFKLHIPQPPPDKPKCWWDSFAAKEVFAKLRQIGIKGLEPEVHFAKEGHPALQAQQTKMDF